MDRRWLLLPLLLGAVGMGAVWLRPFSEAPDTAFTGGHIVAIGVARFELLSGNLGVHTGLAGAPDGVDARTLLWPLNLLALPLGPVAAFNLLVFAVPTLNALGGARLAHALGLDRRAATVLALLLAWNPWVHATMANGQLEQAVIGGAAWMWAAAIEGGVVELSLLTLGLGIAAPHVTLAGLVGLPFLARKRLGIAIPGVLLALGGVWLWHAPGFDPQTRHLFAPFGSGATGAEAPVAKHTIFPWELVWPAPPPPVRIRPVVHMGYLGAALLGTAVLGLRRRPALGLVTVVALALAVGLLPVDGIPMVARSATPYRFVITALIAVSALAASARWGPALVLIGWVEAFAVDRRGFPWPRADFTEDGSTGALPDDGGLVLDLPAIGPSCRNATTHHLVEAQRSGHPVPSVLRDGPEAFPGRAEAAVRLDRALRASPCSPDLRPAIAAFAPAYVVGHLHLPCRLPVQAPACLEAALGPPTGQDARGVWWAFDPPAAAP